MGNKGCYEISVYMEERVNPLPEDKFQTLPN